jgi:hypothetical protein
MIAFIVGPPGVGKTTLVRSLLGMQGPALPFGGYLTDRPKWTVCEKICAAGHYIGEPFDGADTVPYNGVNEALAYWDAALSRHPVTIFDGDRFSYEKVMLWARARSHVCVISLTLDDPTLVSRRASRGSMQNPSWMVGRATKARRFAEAFDGIVLDSSDLYLEERVRSILSLD